MKSLPHNVYFGYLCVVPQQTAGCISESNESCHTPVFYITALRECVLGYINWLSSICNFYAKSTRHILFLLVVLFLSHSAMSSMAEILNEGFLSVRSIWLCWWFHKTS